MIYLSSADINLILYIVKERHKKEEREYYSVKAEEIPYYINRGSIVKPKYYILKVEDRLKEEDSNKFKKHSQFNTTYICAPDINNIKDKIISLEYIEYLKIDIRNIKKSLMSPYKGYFENEEAFEEFWKLFKNKPKVLQGELVRIYSTYVTKNLKINKEEIEERYIYLNQGNKKESDLIINCLGKAEGNEFLFNLEDTKLFTYFVGTTNYPAYLINYFKNSNQGGLLCALDILVSSILNRGNIKLHVLIFQFWLISINYINLKDTDYILSKIETLENTLKGY